MYGGAQNGDLQILAFPCNQFGKQEPCKEHEIKNFAKSYGVQFDLFSKVIRNKKTLCSPISLKKSSSFRSTSTATENTPCSPT